MNIAQLVEASSSPQRMSALLDELDAAERKALVLTLRPRQLARLFDVCADNAPARLADIVPDDVPPLTEVIHHGKNSLPLFSQFQKRFCRPPSAEPKRLWGYNEQTMRALTGPGYFVVHHVEGELAVDYRELPSERPSSWPPILSNQARLSRFVYEGSVDVLRKLGRGVTVGRVYKAGKAQDAWFALARADR